MKPLPEFASKPEQPLLTKSCFWGGEEGPSQGLSWSLVVGNGGMEEGASLTAWHPAESTGQAAKVATQEDALGSFGKLTLGLYRLPEECHGIQSGMEPSWLLSRFSTAKI